MTSEVTRWNVRCKKCFNSSTTFSKVYLLIYYFIYLLYLFPFAELLEFSEDASGVPEGNKKSTNKQGDKSKENTRKIFSGPKRVSNNT